MQGSSFMKKEVKFDLRDSLEFLRGLYSSAPLSIWASLGKEHNYRIVYWNEGAEKIYGISAEDAIGKNYLDVFVAEEDPQVRRDSENDCDEIINNGKTFVNYMAVDNKVVNGVKSPNYPILLLTNVFRIIVGGQGYQVEMAVDVTSSGLLKFRKPEFRQLKQIVAQVEKEVQLTTYENISTINDTRKLETLILNTIIELTEANAAIFVVPISASAGPLTLKSSKGLTVKEENEIRHQLNTYPSWKDWEQEYINDSYANREIEMEQLGNFQSQFVVPIFFSATIFGAVVVFANQALFFDTRKKESIKSFLARVSGLYEISTKYDFNRNYRMSLAHELLSQADKVNKALQEFTVEHPEAESNEDLLRAKNSIQQQIDLAANLITAGRDYIPSEEVLNRQFGNIDDRLRAVIASQESNIRDKQQKLRIHYQEVADSPNLLVLKGDPDILERILRIIVNNATKYSPINSTIDLYIDSEVSKLTIRVINDGTITPEILKNAFQDSPLLLQGSNKDGAHVGLHVSRTMARRFGGDVLLENNDGRIVATLIWPLATGEKVQNA